MENDTDCARREPGATPQSSVRQRRRGARLRQRPNAASSPTNDRLLDRALDKWLHTHSAFALEAAAGAREYFGELLILAGRITPQQLAEALAEQHTTGERLGHLLARKGWITDAERDIILAFQASQAGHDGPLRLGRLLLTTGIINVQQLDDAIARQQTVRKKLGEILVEAGYVTPGQVARGLRLQRRLVKMALLFLLSSWGAMSSQPALADEHMQALTVTAVVLPNVRMNVLRQVAELTVTSPDVVRGYVDIPAGSVLDITGQTRQGFALSFDTALPLFSAVDISGLEGSAKLSAEGGTITQRDGGHLHKTLTLGYRFYLSKDTRPGTYAWPLVLSVRPVGQVAAGEH